MPSYTTGFSTQTNKPEKIEDRILEDLFPQKDKTMNLDDKKKSVDRILEEVRLAIHEGLDLNKGVELSAIELVALTASTFYQFAVFHTMLDANKQAAAKAGDTTVDDISDEDLAKVLKYVKKPGPLVN